MPCYTRLRYLMRYFRVQVNSSWEATEKKRSLNHSQVTKPDPPITNSEDTEQLLNYSLHFKFLYSEVEVIISAQPYYIEN